MVLFADGLTAFFDFDAASFIRKLLGRDVAPLDRMQRMHEADGETAGRAEAGAARRDVRHRGDLKTALESEHVQAFAHDGMLQLRSLFDFLGARIADSQGVVELPAHGDVNVFVDGCGDDGTTVLPVVSG